MILILNSILLKQLILILNRVYQIDSIMIWKLFRVRASMRVHVCACVCLCAQACVCVCVYLCELLHKLISWTFLHTLER